MAQFGQGHVFPLAHLPLGPPHPCALLFGEHVVGVNHLLGLDKHAIRFPRESDKIPLSEIEVFVKMPRDDHLAAPPDPPNGFSYRW